MSVAYGWYILQLSLKKSLELNLKKYSDCLTGLGLTLWYIRFGPEEYLD